MHIQCAGKLAAILLSTDVTVSVPAIIYIGEEDGKVQVCVTLSAMERIETNFTITLTTSDGTGLEVIILFFK